MKKITLRGAAVCALLAGALTVSACASMDNDMGGMDSGS